MIAREHGAGSLFGVVARRGGDLSRLLLLLLLAAGCSATQEPAVTATVPLEPHMRAAEQGAASAVYFMLRNPSPDTLVLHGVEIDVAGGVAIHRSTDTNGMAGMVMQDSVIVPPQDSVAFQERGLHVMATNLHTALRVGDTVVVRLLLQKSRVDTLRVPVRE